MEEISMDRNEIKEIITRVQNRLIELENENDKLKKKLKSVEDEARPYMGSELAGRILAIIRR